MKKQFIVLFVMLIAILIGGCTNGANEEMIGEIGDLKTQVAQLSAENEKLEEELQELKQENIQNDLDDENTSDSENPFPAYTAWIEKENSASERDVYESIFTGFLYADDEISRGWLDEGTVKFLTLIKGNTVSSDAYASELKKIYKSLDDKISNTDYSIRDFFCVDQYGDPVSTGIYNFFRAIDQLEASESISPISDQSKIIASNLLNVHAVYTYSCLFLPQTSSKHLPQNEQTKTDHILTQAT